MSRLASARRNYVDELASYINAMRFDVNGTPHATTQLMFAAIKDRNSGTAMAVLAVAAPTPPIGDRRTQAGSLGSQEWL